MWHSSIDITRWEAKGFLFFFGTWDSYTNEKKGGSGESRPQISRFNWSLTQTSCCMVFSLASSFGKKKKERKKKSRRQQLPQVRSENFKINMAAARKEREARWLYKQQCRRNGTRGKSSGWRSYMLRRFSPLFSFLFPNSCRPDDMAALRGSITSPGRLRKRAKKWMNVNCFGDEICLQHGAEKFKRSRRYCESNHHKPQHKSNPLSDTFLKQA